jgi:hypothetical protein
VCCRPINVHVVVYGREATLVVTHENE